MFPTQRSTPGFLHCRHILYHLNHTENVKSRKETPVHMSYQPPTILLTGIHLAWAMHMTSGRPLNQNDWPKAPLKLTLSPKNMRLGSYAEQSVCFLLSCCSLPGCPFPVKSLCFSENYFQVSNRSPLPGLGPTSCNTSVTHATLLVPWDFLILCCFWHNKCVPMYEHLL